MPRVCMCDSRARLSMRASVVVIMVVVVWLLVGGILLSVFIVHHSFESRNFIGQFF